MLEGAIYCLLIMVWCFVSSYEARDQVSSSILTVIGTLFGVRFVFIIMGALHTHSGFLGS